MERKGKSSENGDARRQGSDDAETLEATLSVRERMLSGAESVRKSARKLTMKRLLTERSMKEMIEEVPEFGLFYMKRTNLFRQGCIYFMNTQSFKTGTLLAILVNCAFLAMDTNRPGYPATEAGRASLLADHIFNAIFGTEMLVKIVALGFVVGEGSYLQDKWNILDFVVVTLGLLQYISQVQNFTVLRTVRVLRPLRTMTRIKGMKELVSKLIAALPLLGDVVVLVSFEYVVFGIIGVQIFNGGLGHQCAVLYNPRPECAGCNTAGGGGPGDLTLGGIFDTIPIYENHTERIQHGNFTVCPSSCTLPDIPLWRYMDTYKEDRCSWPRVSDYPRAIIGDKRRRGRACRPGWWCVATKNPDYGFTSYDNILWAWLNIFNCITMTNWTSTMYMMQDTVSQLSWIFFVAIILFGTYFAINLAIAVLFAQFSEARVEDSSSESSEGSSYESSYMSEEEDWDGEGSWDNGDGTEGSRSMRRDTLDASSHTLDMSPRMADGEAGPNGNGTGKRVDLLGLSSGNRARPTKDSSSKGPENGIDRPGSLGIFPNGALKGGGSLHAKQNGNGVGDGILSPRSALASSSNHAGFTPAQSASNGGLRAGSHRAPLQFSLDEDGPSMKQAPIQSPRAAAASSPTSPSRPVPAWMGIAASQGISAGSLVATQGSAGLDPALPVATPSKAGGRFLEENGLIQSSLTTLTGQEAPPQPQSAPAARQPAQLSEVLSTRRPTQTSERSDSSAKGGTAVSPLQDSGRQGGASTLEALLGNALSPTDNWQLPEGRAAYSPSARTMKPGQEALALLRRGSTDDPLPASASAAETPRTPLAHRGTFGAGAKGDDIQPFVYVDNPAALLAGADGALGDAPGSPAGIADTVPDLPVRTADAFGGGPTGRSGTGPMLFTRRASVDASAADDDPVAGPREPAALARVREQGHAGSTGDLLAEAGRLGIPEVEQESAVPGHVLSQHSMQQRRLGGAKSAARVAPSPLDDCGDELPESRPGPVLEALDGTSTLTQSDHGQTNAPARRASRKARHSKGHASRKNATRTQARIHALKMHFRHLSHRMKHYYNVIFHGHLHNMARRVVHSAARPAACAATTPLVTTEEITTVMIVANTILMAAIYYRMPVGVARVFEYCNYGFTSFFALEMLLRMYADGLRHYFTNRMNVFDFVVVVASFVEIALMLTVGDQAGSLSVLRSLRLMRIFKLVARWKQLNEMISIIARSVSKLSYLFLLMVLYMFVFALLGKQFFSYKLFDCHVTGIPNARPLCPPGVALKDCPHVYHCYAPCTAAQNGTWVTYANYGFDGPVDAIQQIGFPYFDGTRYLVGGLCSEYAPGTPQSRLLVDLGASFLPQGNFENIYQGILTIFRILTFDNWTDVLFSCLRATHPAYALYFVLLICIGNYILLNLFLAILLDHFGRHHKMLERQKRKERKLGVESNKPEGLLGFAARAAVTGTKRISGRFATSKLGSFIQAEVLAPTEDRKRSTHSKMGSMRNTSMRNTSFAMQSSMQMTSTNNLNSILDSVAQNGDGKRVRRSADGDRQRRRQSLDEEGGDAQQPARPKPRASKRMSEAFLENLVSPGGDTAQAATTGRAARSSTTAHKLQSVNSKPRASRASMSSLEDVDDHPRALQQSQSRLSAAAAAGLSPRLATAVPQATTPVGAAPHGRSSALRIDDRLTIQEEIKNIVRRESIPRHPLPPAQHDSEARSIYPSIQYMKKDPVDLSPVHLAVTATQPRTPLSVYSTSTEAGLSTPAGSVPPPLFAAGGTSSSEAHVPLPALPPRMAAANEDGPFHLGPLAGPGPVSEAYAHCGNGNAIELLGWRGSSGSESDSGADSDCDRVWPRPDGWDSDPGPLTARSRALCEAREGAERLGRGRPGPVAEAWGFSGGGAPAGFRGGAVEQRASEEEPLNSELMAWGTKKSGAVPVKSATQLAMEEQDAETLGSMAAGTQKSGAGGNWATPGRNPSQATAGRSRHTSTVAPELSRKPTLTKKTRKAARELTGEDEKAEQAYQYLVERLEKIGPLQGPTSGVTGRVATIVGKLGASFIGTSLRGASNFGLGGGASMRGASNFGLGGGASMRGASNFGLGGGASMRGASQFGPQQSRKSNALRTATSKINLVVTEMPLVSSSLFILGVDNPIRIFLHGVLTHRIFEIGIMMCILGNATILALDHPRIDHNSSMKAAINLCDFVFILVFAAEMLLKIIVQGLVLHPHAYLRSKWNVLDGIVTFFGVITLVLKGTGADVSFFRAARSMRALRPLRVAVRFEGLKLVIDSLMAAVPGIGNVILVTFLFYIMFGILGLNLFLGSLWYCEDQIGNQIHPAHYNLDGRRLTDQWCFDNMGPDGGHHWLMCPEGDTRPTLFRGNVSSWSCAELTPGVTIRDGATGIMQTAGAMFSCTPLDLNATGRADRTPVLSMCPPMLFTHTWRNQPNFNFDNVGFVILNLFEMASQESWTDVQYATAAVVGIGQQPVRDNNTANMLYTLVYMVVGSFFLINLFVGVTIDKFNEIARKRNAQKPLLVTQSQWNWMQIHDLMCRAKPKRSIMRSEGGIQDIAHKLILTSFFENLILVCILANTAVMAAQRRNEPPLYTSTLNWFNDGFTFIFCAEAIVKLIALGLRGYFVESWNVFDFSIVCLSIVGVVISLIGSGKTSFLNLLRVLRVARAFRLIPKAKGLKTLFNTLLRSLPSMSNVAGVVGIIYFIYAILGMNLFGHLVERGPLNRHVNFYDFPTSMLILVRMTTGENWNSLMHAAMVMHKCKEVADPSSPLFGQLLDYEDSRLESIPVGLVKDGCAPFGSTAVAIIYFCSFMLLCAYVLLNLMAAVIIEKFIQSQDTANLSISVEMISEFTEVWSDLDPRATRFIAARNIERLLKELSPPLGVKGLFEDSGLKKEVQRIVLSSKIPCHPGGYIQFYETLHGLATRAAFAPLDDEFDPELEARQERMELELIQLMPSLAHRGAMGPTPYDAGHFMAALYVQSAIRGFLARHQPAEKPTPVEVTGPVSGPKHLLQNVAGLMRRISDNFGNFGVKISRRMGSMPSITGGNPDRKSAGDQGMPEAVRLKMQESIRLASTTARWDDPSIRGGGAGPSMRDRPSDTGSMSGAGTRRGSVDPSRLNKQRSTDPGGILGRGRSGESGEMDAPQAQPQPSRRLSRLWG